MKIYHTVENFFCNIFFKYGVFISKHPLSAIGFAVLLNGLLGLQIMWIKSDSNLEKLYTPTNSRASQDRSDMKRFFTDGSGSNFYLQHLRDLGHYCSVILASNDNIFNQSNLPYFQNISHFIRHIEIKDKNGIPLAYEDICARRNSKCIVDGDIFLTDFFWTTLSEFNVTFPLFRDLNGTETDLETITGGALVKGETLQRARAIKLIFYLRQDSEYFLDISREWELKFITEMKSVERHNGIDVAYANSDSLNQELDSNTDNDVAYFSLTFTLMITYASFVTAGGNCLTQRGHLGRAGVIATGLAILGAFGICAGAGIEYVNIVGVMPFLIVGIGVDDMFVLLSGLASAPLDLSISQRIGHTMKTSGIAITITSLTDIVAFSIGNLSVFMSVRHFCIYTGIAVVLCYVNQMTFFVGCMTLHERRVKSKRHCLTCIKITDDEDLGKTSTIKSKLCGGTLPKTRKEMLSIFEKIPELIFPKLISFPPVTIFIVICFFCYVGFAAYGVSNLQQGLVLTNLVSDNSYYYKYSSYEFDLFTTRFFVSFVTENKETYSSRTTYDKHIRLKQTILSNPKTDLAIDWYESYINSRFLNNKSEEEFCRNLNNVFLQSYEVFSNDIVFDKNFSEVMYSRFHVLTKDIKESKDQGIFMNEMRDIAKEFSVVAYSPAFIFFEQYVAVLPNTLQTVGIAIGAIFLVTVIFIPHPIMILLVTLSMASILFGVFGFMYLWDLSLSSITMIHLIMSVGFSVDFSAHFCHAYMSSNELDRGAYVNVAFQKAGGPIFNGAVSSIVGIIMLVFSKSFVFRSFFKVMLLVIIFGFVHALLFLPVALLLIGPKPNKQKEDKVVNEVGKVNNGFHL
ncbi:hypothetical protein FSP39_007097 [Pinctada imbricata]|uniref:SSD domain-containing protein n=1 Tax=Pinctada imbricata TaxID=66713 RepID=A0AA89BYZ1_PINIB|nr:hypothetical protein FSP39_007097 [Pinctada imbricata]